MTNSTTWQGMLYQTLGSTGEKVSAIGIGGWHIGLNSVDEQLSIRIIRTAINRGINFMDNCWDYNEGISETRMGKALREGYRKIRGVRLALLQYHPLSHSTLPATEYPLVLHKYQIVQA
jgi:predicted aldo/keto reductase-like oxidoreductase